jgi:hypothetical protein
MAPSILVQSKLCILGKMYQMVTKQARGLKAVLQFCRFSSPNQGRLPGAQVCNWVQPVQRSQTTLSDHQDSDMLFGCISTRAFRSKD